MQGGIFIPSGVPVTCKRSGSNEWTIFRPDVSKELGSSSRVQVFPQGNQDSDIVRSDSKSKSCDIISSCPIRTVWLGMGIWLASNASLRCSCMSTLTLFDFFGFLFWPVSTPWWCRLRASSHFPGSWDGSVRGTSWSCTGRRRWSGLRKFPPIPFPVTPCRGNLQRQR